MNNAVYTSLPIGEKFIVDWQYQTGGSFKTMLADAMSIADEFNLKRLSRGFPDETHCMIQYKNTKGWWQDIQNKLIGVE